MSKNLLWAFTTVVTSAWLALSILIYPWTPEGGGVVFIGDDGWARFPAAVRTDDGAVNPTENTKKDEIGRLADNGKVIEEFVKSQHHYTLERQNPDPVADINIRYELAIGLLRGLPLATLGLLCGWLVKLFKNLEAMSGNQPTPSQAKGPNKKERRRRGNRMRNDDKQTVSSDEASSEDAV